MARLPGACPPLVSVVMPAFNCRAFVRQAIGSVLAQTHSRWELLVADDASADGTRALIDAFDDRRIRRFHNEHRLGYLRTCNMLFGHCTGELVTFQDADDFSELTRLERQVAAFATDVDLGMCGTWVTLVDSRGDPIAEDRRPTSYAEIRSSLASRSPFCGATIMVRRDLLQTIGGYRDFFDGYSFQDYDWAYRIAERHKSINLPELLYSYRQHPASNSKIIAVRRAIGARLVQALARQRLASGADVVMQRDPVGQERLIEELSRPYRLDPSLLYREAAAAQLSMRLWWPALRAAGMGVRARPWSLLNWRTLGYCARRAVRAAVWPGHPR